MVQGRRVSNPAASPAFHKIRILAWETGSFRYNPITVANADPSRGASAEFVRLLTGNQRKLYAFILSLLRRPADADDVLQETNMVMWRKCAEFEPGTNFDA